jgi:DNA primase
MSTGEKNNKLGIIVAVLAVAVIALGVMLYLRSEENHKVELEKQALTMELSDLKEDLLDQLGDNDSLNSYIQYESARLGAIIDSINTVNVQNKKLLTTYRSRLGGMKKQNDMLVAQLDSANEAYAALKLREQMMADSLNTAIEANADLSNVNNRLTNTVAKGKQLVVATSTVQAVRVANNGNERKTRRANRADRINTCVTLAENKIADRGNVTLYVKWFDTKGKPVDAPEENQAVVGGERSGFNGSATVDYQGQSVEVCVAANRATDAPVELTAGIYTMAVYTDSYLVGTVAVELK